MPSAAQFRAVHCVSGKQDVSGDSGVKQFRFPRSRCGWQLFMLHPNGVPSFTASGPIDNGTEMLTSTEMTIQKKQLGERGSPHPFISGKGRLTLHYVEVERIR